MNVQQAKATVESQGTPSILTLQNYGYVLKEKTRAGIVAANAKLTFVINLPERPTIQKMSSINCSHQGTYRVHTFVDGSTAKCEATSASFELLFETQAALINDISQHIMAIHSILKSFDDNDRRPKRAWLPFIGSALHTITGVSTDDSVEDLRQAVQRLETLTVTASETWKDGANSFMTATKLNSDRIQNLVKMIDLHKSSIHSLYATIAQEYQQFTNINQLFAKEQRRIANAMFILSDLDS